MPDNTTTDECLAAVIDLCNNADDGLSPRPSVPVSDLRVALGLNVEIAAPPQGHRHSGSDRPTARPEPSTKSGPQTVPVVVWMDRPLWHQLDSCADKIAATPNEIVNDAIAYYLGESS